MKPILSRIAAAALLSACALGAQAQAPAPATPASQPGMHMQDHHRMHQQHMQQRMQERHVHRMERLKRILQITPQQEGAWTAWTTAMKPAAKQRPNRDEFARMTTPQRIDALKQLRGQRMAEQDRRGDATKTFYAQLSGPQQKAFDEVSLKLLSRGGKRGGDMHQRHHGRWNS